MLVIATTMFAYYDVTTMRRLALCSLSLALFPHPPSLLPLLFQFFHRVLVLVLICIVLQHCIHSLPSLVVSVLFVITTFHLHTSVVVAPVLLVMLPVTATP